MKKWLGICTLFLLTGCFDDNELDTFKVVDTIGGIHYVVVGEGDVSKRDALHAAAKGVCDALVQKSPLPPTCYVLFWTDISKMPSGLVITADNQRAVVASYVQKPGSPDDFRLMKNGLVVQ